MRYFNIFMLFTLKLMNTLKKSLLNMLFLSIILTISNSCSSGFFKKVDTREVPINASDRARKAVTEGKGIAIGNIFKGGNTNYEFSTSNPMWRASLEILDFLPLATVDYSGGIIISDWYSTNNDDSIKLSLRFLSNEIGSNSIKITVFKKKCTSENNCTINQSDSKIREELIKNILTKAAELEKQDKVGNK